MKQIIIVTNHKERYEKEIPKTDLYVTWCELKVESLIGIRSRSNLIFIIMDHEKKDDLDRMALYLRDVCIEDEKYVYLYGNKEDVDTMTSKIPSMFVKKKMYSFSHFDLLIDIVVKEEVKAENGKPMFLLIDDDSEYAERLRVYLDPHFRVLISRFDPEEIDKLVAVADVVLISMDGKLRLSEFMTLFRLLAAKKKIPRFAYYFISDSDSERNFNNSGVEKSSISFSKEMDPERVAKYLIGRIKG